MKKQPIAVDRWATHLDTDEIAAGDTVIGVLPLHSVAKICAKGAIFMAINVELAERQRGRELTAREMEDVKCSLQRYEVRAL